MASIHEIRSWGEKHNSMLAAGRAVSLREECRRLEIALRPGMMAPHLAAVFGPGSAARSPGAPAPCHVLDVKYEPGVGCSILYRFGDRLVMGRYRIGMDPAEIPATAPRIDSLGMEVYSFEQDPALPGLPAAIDPWRMRAVLERALPECRSGEARVGRCRTAVLRYRPGRRCTLRYELWLRDRSRGTARARTLYGKVYHDVAKAASVFGEMKMLADSAPAREGRLITARAVAFLPELGLVLQEPVDGMPVASLLEGIGRGRAAVEDRGWDAVVGSARALAALHTAGLSTRRERPIAAELKRFAERATRATEADRAVGARLAELAAALPAWAPRLPEWNEQITLVHGDCKPTQCLVTPRGIAILDFDHCGMADPATDVGTYLATLRQLGLRPSVKPGNTAAATERTRWLEALANQFLDAYCRASGASSGFRLRARWYEAVALLRKALRSFARSSRSPMPLAQVEEAWRILLTLPLP